MRKNIPVVCQSVVIAAAGLAAAAATQAQDTTNPAAGTNTVAQAAQGTAAPGQNQLEEVVVTAERQTINNQKAPESISVRTGADLLDTGKSQTTQILEDIPGVTAVSLGTGFTTSRISYDNVGATIAIRGVRPNSAFSPVPLAPPTAVYTDGVYEGIGSTYDISRVEVLRGPQGTDYGRSATSGVVASFTNDPKLGQFAGNASAEIGDYNLQHFSAAVNAPLGQMFALRASADSYRRSGYDSKDGGADDDTQGRIKLLYQPNQNLSVLLGYATSNDDFNLGGETIALHSTLDTNHTSYNPLPINTAITVAHQYWGDLQWNLGPANLTYIPAFRTWYQNAAQPNAGPGGLDVVQVGFTPTDQFITHELRLASNPDSKISWQVGGFYYNNHMHTAYGLSYLFSGAMLNQNDERRTTKDTGVFGNVTIPFTGSTRLTLGLRRDSTDVDESEVYSNNNNSNCGTPVLPPNPPPGCVAGPPNSPVNGTPTNILSLSVGGPAGQKSFQNWTYKARLEQDLTPSNMVYGLVSTGFVPGDVTILTGQTGLPTLTTYKEETLTSYEVGSKNRFFNNTLQANGDIWYYRYGAYQINLTPDPTNFISQIAIAQPARMWGIEVDVDWLPTPDDHLSASYGYTDSYLVNRNNVVASLNGVPETFNEFYLNNHIAGVIPQLLTLSYDHNFHLPGGSLLTPRINGRMIGGYFEAVMASTALRGLGYAEKPYVYLHSQYIGDFSLTWTPANSAFSLNGYVRNFANNRYFTTAGAQVLAPVVVGTVSRYDPRTYGVVASVKF